MRRLLVVRGILSLALCGCLPALAADGAPIDRGLRILVCGHSFHWGIAGPLEELAKAAALAGGSVEVQKLGGSRVIQHWDLPDARNPAKRALQEGRIDVLTLSPRRAHPDDGIDRFVALGLMRNPDLRVVVQQSWFGWDTPDTGERLPMAQREAFSAADLLRIHAEYYRDFEAQIAAINAGLARPAVFTVPVSRALIVLRDLARRGEMPGIVRPMQLFTDAQGHPGPLATALNAYCHFAVIYRRDPRALPPLASVAALPDGAAIDRRLKEIAWAAVTAHPQSGVAAGP